MKPKSILITGCSSGIGLSAADILRKRGYRVFATARKKEDVAMLKERGHEALRLNVDDAASIQKAVSEVLRRTHGKLDALFNNAGFGVSGALEDMPRDALRAQFETNLFGPIELTNLIIPAMRKQGYGRIIWDSSVLGFVVFPYSGPYCASKHAMEAIADAYRMELRGTGIHTSVIEPGPILTRFRENAYKAFTRWVDREKSLHKNAYDKMIARLRKDGPAMPFTLPPEAVVKTLMHALKAPKPKARYYVTFPTYLFALLKRILPAKALDKILVGVR
ncbi:TPA: SDR family NAD(P)-dependent oxidoreductase [Candidatus Woesearchaeota archaeon]|nr:SDR family NAD(P)-dependent oxidoreductase [Candidatus Woesearchaeota archaeon]